MHVLYLLGTLAAAQAPPGFVVVHFGPSADVCPADVGTRAAAATAVKVFRTPEGSPVVVTGHVALRFKSTTSHRQVDSLIAANGLEVFTPAYRSGCRRYVLAVTTGGADATSIAAGLRASGLVDYATPDLQAGRSEGIPRDSFYVDPAALRSVLSRGTPSVAPEPGRFGMGQVLADYSGPLMRMDAPGMSALLSSVNGSASAVEFVKTRGLTSLRIDVPDGPEQSNVRVIVYTLSGTAVRELVSETLDAGNYLVGWDGNDDRGRRVQPGVYVVIMTAGSFRETRRLVIR